jgi:hypothetical protein
MERITYRHNVRRVTSPARLSNLDAWLVALGLTIGTYAGFFIYITR